MKVRERERGREGERELPIGRRQPTAATESMKSAPLLAVLSHKKSLKGDGPNRCQLATHGKIPCVAHCSDNCAI